MGVPQRDETHEAQHDTDDRSPQISVRILNTAQKVFLARIASRAVLVGRMMIGKPPVSVCRRAGVNWLLDVREAIDLSIYLVGAFERSTVRSYSRLVRAGDVVIDIGANIGAHALPLAILVGVHGRVIAFEPTAFAAGKFRTNVALNAELGARIVLHQIMLVANNADPLDAAIYSSWPLSSTEGLHRTHRGRLMGTEGAYSATLDSVLKMEGCSMVNFVKLDVDGNEVAVLKGAEETIAKFRPTIALEVAPYVHEEHGYSFEELVDFLRSRGYFFYALTNDERLPSTAKSLRRIAPRNGGVNVIARYGAR